MRKHNETIEHHDAGTAHRQATIQRIRVSDAPYGWLRLPAGVIGAVGLLGIVIHHVESAAAMFWFLRMPQEVRCYLITAGAAILFGLSLVGRRRERKIRRTDETAMPVRTRWRSV